jgi:hypothetical protein
MYLAPEEMIEQRTTIATTPGQSLHRDTHYPVPSRLKALVIYFLVISWGYIPELMRHECLFV